MEITFVYKIAAVGLIIALLNQVLQKSGKEEYTTLTTIAGLILALLMLLPKLKELTEAVESFFQW